jgi:hypothetical protein
MLANCQPPNGPCRWCGALPGKPPRTLGMGCSKAPRSAKELTLEEAEWLRALLPHLKAMFPEVQLPETYQQFGK